MKLATFSLGGEAPRLGIVQGDQLLDVAATANPPATSVKEALTGGPRVLDQLRELAARGGSRRSREEVTLLPPVPDTPLLLCVGKNSRKHREELVERKMLLEDPKEPTGFVKLVQTMVGDDAAVRRPDGITTLDYEPELTFVLGRTAHGVKKADARGYIAGITLLNDLTAREVQKREVATGTKFWTAKNMPGFSPVGPCVATMDEAGDPDDLWVTCTVNGEQRLRVNTSELIFRIGDILEHFSRYMVLEAGTLIATGAPRGTAFSQPDPDALYLRPGDVCDIAFEGLMSLRTRIV